MASQAAQPTTLNTTRAAPHNKLQTNFTAAAAVQQQSLTPRNNLAANFLQKQGTNANVRAEEAK